MNQNLQQKVDRTIRLIREIWPQVKHRKPFIAFSTGKDSLAMTALIYEALSPVQLPCLYSHHDLEFECNLEYVSDMRSRGFNIEVVSPFLSYFELMDRGISFLTLVDPWCVPYLVGTGLLDWMRRKGLHRPEQGFMFRGMSGSEYSCKYHTEVEVYKRLRLPCCNPLLEFTKDEILELIADRYGLPMNPIYKHMDRTYCICCYTSDQQRQKYAVGKHPDIYKRYYHQIEEMLFDSGLLAKSHLDPKYNSKEEKLERHGFVYWRRSPNQDSVGAVKYRIGKGTIAYRIRDIKWLDEKHLFPVRNNYVRIGSELRFHGVSDRVSDAVVKRMINCLNCGFCTVECLQFRRFDSNTKQLKIESCIGCGKCLTLKYCLGWRHRFWRSIIVEEKRSHEKR